MPIIDGCSIGWDLPSILADGSITPCPFTPIIIGKLSNQSFEDIFLKNTLLKKTRRREFFKKCSTCDLYQTCRGCLALTYNEKKSLFEKNPLCFRDSIDTVKTSHKQTFKSPPLNISKKEEFDLINFNQKLKNKIREWLNETFFRNAYLLFHQNNKEREQFIISPKTYIKNRYVPS